MNRIFAIIIFIFFNAEILYSLEGKDFLSGNDYCLPINFRNIKSMREFFETMVNKLGDHPQTDNLELLVCASEVANLLWNVAPTREEEMRISLFGYRWASKAKEISPERYDIIYLNAVNLLMYSYSRGVVESLKFLDEIKRNAEKVYQKAPDFLEYSPAILLGALYAEAPWFPIAFGNVEKAEKFFQEAIEKAPKNTTGYIFLARLYFRTGKPEKGALYLKKLLEIPHRKSRKTIGEKDLDFWWHVDKVRTILALKGYKEKLSNTEIANIIDSGPRTIKGENLEEILKSVEMESGSF